MLKSKLYFSAYTYLDSIMLVFDITKSKDA